MLLCMVVSGIEGLYYKSLQETSELTSHQIIDK